MASAVSALVFLLAALLVLGRAGYWRGGTIPAGVFRWSVWVFAGLLPLSALSNFASSSPWERFLLGPSALLLALLCVIVALGADGQPDV